MRKEHLQIGLWGIPAAVLHNNEANRRSVVLARRRRMLPAYYVTPTADDPDD
jgi:hypothetical protein